MNTQTVSFLKQNAANLPLEDEPLQITQHGVPVYRIYSEQQAKLQEDAIALLKLANLAERDIKSGHLMSLEEAAAAIKDL